MGIGLNFKCQKCGKEYRVMRGVGMMFPLTYERTMEAIKEGRYGEQWKQIVTETSYAAVNAEKEVYLCSSCGSWRTERNLSLYRPNDPEQIRTKQYGIKTVEEWGDVPYVDRDDLKRDYKLIKAFPHKCGKCGKRMRKAKEAEIKKLPCPRCGTVNSSNGILLWD